MRAYISGIAVGDECQAMESEDEMTIDLNSLARRIQPAVILKSVQKLVAQQVENRKRQQRRYMNG